MQQQTSGHTLKAFDQDIDRVRALISQMGGLAEHAIGEAMRCLIQRESKTRHLRQAMVLFVLGFAFYCLSIALMLASAR